MQFNYAALNNYVSLQQIISLLKCKFNLIVLSEDGSETRNFSCLGSRSKIDDFEIYLNCPVVSIFSSLDPDEVVNLPDQEITSSIKVVVLDVISF